MRILPKSSLLALGTVLLVLLVLPAMSVYYELSGGKSCARCHEIWQPYVDWRESTHRNVSCQDCHGDVLTLEAGFHLNNIRRLVTHLGGNVPEKVRLRTEDVFRVSERCRRCHEQEYADWQAGPHSATYRDVFLDATHNRQRLLMDDCLRCHGMHFEGSIRDVVRPIDTTGPWELVDAKLSSQPVMPCLTCHQVHHEGLPLSKPPATKVAPGGREEIFRPSLALFDRRQLAHLSVSRLPLPAMLEGGRGVDVSPDPRQALCYQCHAPLDTRQVRSGDDRTTVGVHEGLSCLACHQKHRQTTRASCKSCHPRLSNCGLDVETMDTTFRALDSPHNIHFVKCTDCHIKGIPKRRAKPAPIWSSAAGR